MHVDQEPTAARFVEDLRRLWRSEPHNVTKALLDLSTDTRRKLSPHWSAGQLNRGTLDNPFRCAIHICQPELSVERLEPLPKVIEDVRQLVAKRCGVSSFGFGNGVCRLALPVKRGGNT